MVKLEAKAINSSGKRKMSIARAIVKDGKGRIKINSVPLDIYEPELSRSKIKESLVIASDHVDLSRVDIDVAVYGGGVVGQSVAVISAIARGLVDWTKNDNLLSAYLNYDRTMIAGDHRLTETHKPGQSSKGPRHKRQKSYR